MCVLFMLCVLFVPGVMCLFIQAVIVMFMGSSEFFLREKERKERKEEKKETPV